MLLYLYFYGSTSKLEGAHKDVNENIPVNSKFYQLIVF